jgi:hypothetical protein
MEHPDYVRLLADGLDFGIDSSLTVQAFHARCAVDDLVALKLTSVSPKYTPGSVIPIAAGSGATALADLVVCEGQAFGYGSASAHQVAAYLQEVSVVLLGTQDAPRRDYIFTNSYVVVNVADFLDYEQHYRRGSGIWGNFLHSEDQAFPNLSHRTVAPSILGKRDI